MVALQRLLHLLRIREHHHFLLHFLGNSGPITLWFFIITTRGHFVELVVVRLAPLPVRLELVVFVFLALIQHNGILREEVLVMNENFQLLKSRPLNFNSDLVR